MLNPKKLHHSKWTAVEPLNKEKHFLVTKVILPEIATHAIEYIEIEAIHSKRKQLIAWRQLNEIAIWRQGWV